MSHHGDANGMGLEHDHAWELVTTRPGLQSAHDTLRWDVATSRVLSVRRCTACVVLERESITECKTVDCHAHAICERPYR